MFWGGGLPSITAKDDNVLEELSQRVAALEMKKQGYRVKGVVSNCLLVRGIRRQVYDLASQHCGKYTNPDRSKSIGYQNQDLVIDIYFPSEETALGFRNFIEHLGGEDSPLFSGVVLVEDNGKYSIADSISLRHYKPGDSESPPRTFSTGSESGMVASSDIYSVYQAVEPPSVLKESCHMYGNSLPVNPEYPNHKNSKSNRICLSPTLHRLYDGFSGFTPVFAIKPETIHDQPIVLNHGGVSQIRYKVTVLLQFMSLNAKEMFGGGFKEGYVQRTETEFLSEVYVENAQEFVKFMMWKYNNTTEQWP